MLRTSFRKSGFARVLLAVGLAMVSLTVWAKGKAASPRAKYSAALKKVRAAEKTDLEPVYRLGLEAASWLEEKLGEQPDEYADTKLEGFDVSVGEVTGVSLEPDFFLKLARKKGMPADLAFFENLERTYREGGDLPVYRQVMNDVLFCDRFEAPELIPIYRAWRQYAAKYPKSYVEEVKRELDGIESMLLTHKCACGTKEEVLASIAGFIEAFRGTELAAKLNVRLAVLKGGVPNSMKYQCVPE